MTTAPVTLRTCLALLLATILAFAGVSGAGQAGTDPQPALSQAFSDTLHADMNRIDSGAPDHQDNCDSGGICCPGQHHSCAALPGSHALYPRGVDSGAEFTSTPLLDRPQRPPFRPPIA